MPKFESVLLRYNGIGPGFDFLRIALAIMIVAWHCALQLGQMGIRDTPIWFAEYALVPMFFSLSGFLVAGSASRLSLGNFLTNRALRIVPALFVDVVFCALILGPLLTTVSLTDYFSDQRLYKYLLNFTGYIHYYLPGVFENNFNKRVNSALWTVPYEIICYLLMSFLVITGWLRRPIYIGSLIFFFLVVGSLISRSGSESPSYAFDMMYFIFVDSGSRLLVSFLLGILIYQLRSKLPYSWLIFSGCVFACLVASITLSNDALLSIENRYILLPALAYIICFLGLTPIILPRLLHKGDYSYGLYLYHDPLLQTVILFLPALAMMGYVGVGILFILALPLAFAMAILSWHLVERPILRLRKRFSFVAKVRGVAGEKDVSTIAAPIPFEDPSRTEVLGFKLSGTPR